MHTTTSQHNNGGKHANALAIRHCRVASFVYLHSTGPLAQTNFGNGGIIDSAGTKVVEYKYDAWGRPLSKTGSMASTLGTLNPFRYRGYVYDEETGLYYLRHRYYSPFWSRFSNADNQLGNVTQILNKCSFTYCHNSPVLFADSSGYEESPAIFYNEDGSINHYLYTYTNVITDVYTYCPGRTPITIMIPVSREVTGHIYIYIDVPTKFFEDVSNYPVGFVPENDLMVGDYTSSSDPKMYAYQAQKLHQGNREKVLQCLLAYDAERGTPWNRTLKSLCTEWEGHHMFAWASDRAQNIDFNNAEEGKGIPYFIWKALNAVIN